MGEYAHGVFRCMWRARMGVRGAQTQGWACEYARELRIDWGELGFAVTTDKCPYSGHTPLQGVDFPFQVPKVTLKFSDPLDGFLE